MFIDSLASTLAMASTDLIVLDQGGVPGVPGTAVTRAIPAGQFMALAFAAWMASLPTTSAGLSSGAWWNNSGLPQQVP